MIKKSILLLSLLLSSSMSFAQINLDIDASKKDIAISPTLYGIFFEDINHAADGGLYAELIRNRSFEDNDTVAVNWKTFETEPKNSIVKQYIKLFEMDAMFEVPSRKVKSFTVSLDYAKKQIDKANLQKLESA